MANDTVKVHFNQNFTMVQNYVIDSMVFEKPIDKIIYIQLLRYGFQKGQAFPSVPKIAFANGVTENTVRAAIKRLVKIGLVHVEARKKKNGENESNIYHIYDLTEEMKNFNVENDDAFITAKEMDKERKREKVKKGKKDNTPPSKFEPPTSNDEPPTSKIEGEEENNLKKRIIEEDKKNLSIQIDELNVDEDIKTYLHKNLKGLTDRKLKVIEEIFNQNRLIFNSLGDVEFNRSFKMALANIKGKKYNNFAAYLKKTLLNELNTKEAAATVENGTIKRDILPKWLKENKEEKKLTPEEEAAFEKEKARLNDLIKGRKK